LIDGFGRHVNANLYRCPETGRNDNKVRRMHFHEERLIHCQPKSGCIEFYTLNAFWQRNAISFALRKQPKATSGSQTTRSRPDKNRHPEIFMWASSFNLKLKWPEYMFDSF
jgi:hypothetical protein